MNPMELYHALPRDSRTFNVDTIHGKCAAWYDPRPGDFNRFTFQTVAGVLWWHRDDPSLTMEVKAILKSIP